MFSWFFYDSDTLGRQEQQVDGGGNAVTSSIPMHARSSDSLDGERKKEDVLSEKDGDITATFDDLDPVVTATILTQVRRCP